MKTAKKLDIYIHDMENAGRALFCRFSICVCTQDYSFAHVPTQFIYLKRAYIMRNAKYILRTQKFAYIEFRNGIVKGVRRDKKE